MLCGKGVVAIWNDITDQGRADFYEWHVAEHMPERVGIPGFRRGRRYRAIDQATQPEFFTLYETETFEVLVGQDYSSRLNAPTPWTKQATAHFRNTSRGLARVLASLGQGPGGLIATIRFGIEPGSEATAKTALVDLLNGLSRLPAVTGAHLAHADDDASGVRTAESQGRTDIQAPPSWILLIEACTAEALERAVQQAMAANIIQRQQIGRYIHEYTRLKTEWTPG